MPLSAGIPLHSLINSIKYKAALKKIVTRSLITVKFCFRGCAELNADYLPLQIAISQIKMGALEKLNYRQTPGSLIILATDIVTSNVKFSRFPFASF